MVAVAKNKADFKGYTLRALVAHAFEKGLGLDKIKPLLQENFPRKTGGANWEKTKKNLIKFLRIFNKGKFKYEIVKTVMVDAPETPYTIKGVAYTPPKTKVKKEKKAKSDKTKRSSKKSPSPEGDIEVE